MKKESELALDNAMCKIMQDSLNSLPIGVTITDIEGKIIYTNKAEASMHGYTVEELIGNDARIMAPPHLWQRLAFEKLYEMGDWKRKTINIKKNGELFPVRLTSIAIKDVSGMPLGIITVCEDITQQHKSEEMLREVEERYSSLFENAHDMIQSVSADGHFIFVNPAWLKTMGYTWDELKEITIFDILHPSCKPHCVETFKKVMSGESINNVEAIFIAKDGRQILVAGNLNARSIGQKVIASQGIFRDVTKRKKTEEALKTSEQELIRKVKDLEDFYAMAVGRELRMKELKEEIADLKKELEQYRKQ